MADGPRTKAVAAKVDDWQDVNDWQDVGKGASAAAAAPDPRIGTASAAQPGFLESVENDLRTGSSSTFVGKALRAVKAQPLGDKSNPITDTLTGPVKAAQGVQQQVEGWQKGPVAGYSDMAGGSLKMLQGLLNTLNIPLAFAGNAPGGLAEKAIAKVPSVAMEQGGQKLGEVLANAGHMPVDVNAPGMQAMRVQELLQRGAPPGGVSKMINQFVRRITDPTSNPMTLSEARDFYTNATAKTAAEELSKMSGPMRREFAQYVGKLGQSIAAAAEQGGQGANYTQGMQQFAYGAQANRGLRDAAKVGVGAAGGGLLYHLLANRMLQKMF